MSKTKSNWYLVETVPGSTADETLQGIRSLLETQTPDETTDGLKQMLSATGSNFRSVLGKLIVDREQSK